MKTKNVPCHEYHGKSEVCSGCAACGFKGYLVCDAPSKRAGNFYGYINGVGISRHTTAAAALKSARHVWESAAFQAEITHVTKVELKVFKARRRAMHLVSSELVRDIR